MEEREKRVERMVRKSWREESGGGGEESERKRGRQMEREMVRENDGQKQRERRWARE